MNKTTTLEQQSGFLMYQPESGETKIEVRLEDENVWLTQNTMADLFQTTSQNITMHIKAIYNEGELSEEATCKKYLQVREEGPRQVKREIKHYGLDVIIAVGYRVRSHRGTQFRRWATDKLKEYLVKGFAMDDQRLKDGRNLGADYFDELLERIRDIRTSEKRFYRKITDIYSLAVDYDSRADMSKLFFAEVQNKLHWAVHGHTAAELIAERADANKNNMGLKTWKGAKVRSADVTIAKNYLTEKELKSLNRFVAMYLDYAEEQAERQQPMFMKDWKEKLDAFLKFNDRELLQNAGNVSAEIAKKLALEEYKKYSSHRIKKEADQLDNNVEQLADRIKHH